MQKKRKRSSRESDNISSSSSDPNPRKKKYVTFSNENERTHGYDKKITVINGIISTFTQQNIVLYTATFPCRVKSIIWDLQFQREDNTPNTYSLLGWSISKRNQGTNNVLSLDDADEFYSPARDLITGGTIIQKGTFYDDSFANIPPSYPLTFDVAITNTTPTTAVAGTTVGIVAGIDSGAFDGTFEGEVAGSVGDLEGTLTARDGTKLFLQRVDYKINRRKGNTNTFRDMLVGDQLIFSFIQQLDTVTVSTRIFGTIQYFIID